MPSLEHQQIAPGDLWRADRGRQDFGVKGARCKMGAIIWPALDRRLGGG